MNSDTICKAPFEKIDLSKCQNISQSPAITFSIPRLPISTLPSPLPSPISTPRSMLTPLPSPTSSQQQSFNYQMLNNPTITPLNSPKPSQNQPVFNTNDFHISQFKTVVKKSSSCETVGKQPANKDVHKWLSPRDLKSNSLVGQNGTLSTINDRNTNRTTITTSTASFELPNNNVRPQKNKSGRSKEPIVKEDIEMTDVKEDDEEFGAYMLEHLIPQCKQCGVRETPQWRRGWADSWLQQPVLLCNACGLKFAKKLFCPYCCCIYRREDDRFMVNMWVTCASCSRPVHTECERKKQQSLPHHELWIMNPHEYRCPDCRPKEMNY